MAALFELSRKNDICKLQRRISELQEQVEDAKRELASLKGMDLQTYTHQECGSYYDKNSVRQEHRMRIAEDIKRDLSTINGLPLSTFYHADNVRFLYAGERKEVPTWFKDLYQDKFNQR